jgi:aldehyde dehydrogenase (NAD+)
VMLANNTPYGLAASVWTENINLALDAARQIKAGTVWINSTNLLDAASGFGGYRESGYGREGGKEGLFEYVRRAGGSKEKPAARTVRLQESAEQPTTYGPNGLPTLDRTAKQFIGGKQVRADSGYSLAVCSADGRTVGEVGDGNRKDIRNAVEAAQVAAGWAGTTGYNRAQILYYLAENLSARAEEFAGRIVAMNGRDPAGSARDQVALAIERLFTYGAWADKYDGRTAKTPLRGLTIAVPEPLGVIGILCPDEAPLLGFISLLAPAIAMGNTVVVVPSEQAPLSATDFYQVLETSDVPPGVVNIVTGGREALAAVLAAHDGVASVWYFGPAEGVAAVEAASIGNLKRTWAGHGRQPDWFDREDGEGEEFLREATQVKNIWAPYGE